MLVLGVILFILSDGADAGYCGFGSGGGGGSARWRSLDRFCGELVLGPVELVIFTVLGVYGGG